MASKGLQDKVLDQIRPTDKAALKEVDLFLKKLNSEIKKNRIKAKAVLGGSMAKDTFLKGDHDCDIFVKFDLSYKDKDISKMLASLLKQFKPSLVHGSRDYYRVKNDMNYEIVPVLDIKDPKEAANVTDMSPLHVEWVKKHPGFTDDIRLAKQFCKAAGVYGAESYIKGFSGHVLDILVIHYGGFNKLLIASQKWKDKEVIDPEKHYRRDALHKLNRSKTDSPIIIIDPVDPQRNAAAALSSEKLERFRKAAEAFLKSPSEESFTVKEKTVEQLKKESGRNKLVLLDVEAFTGKEDVVGAKLLKAFQQIRNQLNFYDFQILDAGWNWNKKRKAMFWYILDPKDLVPIKKWVGPPLTEKERVQNFKTKHKKTFTEKGRACTYVKRRYVEAEALLDDVIKQDEYLYEKVKKVVRR
ncbi:CCA tRNA nucleotidyltransferase [Candidatus Woesearchaeota archaeon]|nr:CCA tRNA nucleotidyltransferase [Candidatus Woesearchaeota archaeon]